MDIDQVFQKIGELGYQQKCYMALLFLVNIYGAFQMLQVTFTGIDVDSFSCFIKAPNKSGAVIHLNNTCGSTGVEGCGSSIIYHVNFTSIATEWGLICDQAYKTKMSQSIFMGGVMLGAIIFGPLSDKIGRRKTMLITIAGTVFFGCFASFSLNYNMYIALRFICGMFTSGTIIVVFVLTSEMVGSTKRALCCTSLQIFFAVGIVIYSLMGWAITDWRMLTFISSATGAVFTLYYFFIPESPRWLLLHGKVKEARRVLEHIAKKNGHPLPTNWELSIPPTSRSQGIGQMLKHPVLLRRTLVQIYSWFVNSAVYYGLTLAAGNIGSNRYTSTALSGVVELPAYLIVILLLSWLGRRWTLCGFMVVGGTACLTIQLIPNTESGNNLVIILGLIGKLGIAASFAIIYIHSAELFPTLMRNSGMGVVSVAARMGGIIAPFIVLLGSVGHNLQFTVFGFLSFSSGLLNLYLPETVNQPLPETIDDLLNFSLPKTEQRELYQPLRTIDTLDEAKVEKVKEIIENGEREESENEIYSAKNVLQS